MMKRIFLSYPKNEHLELDHLRKALEKNRITAQDDDVVFVDPMTQKFNPDENIREILKKQIESSSEVVVVVTKDSLSSQWMNYEIGMADALNKPITLIGEKGFGKTGLLNNLYGARVVEMDLKAKKTA
jgi:ABC-type lipoprotein export system ATPase subunit